ncbi:elongation factor P [Patescibacteria group bacterium]|nr:elongation factor P [Patescibacteria group bacterium]
MLNASQLRNGTVFEYQGNVYRVVNYKHTHISRRGADIKLKVKDLLRDSVLNLNFSPSDKFEAADIRHQVMQFLYQDEDQVYFMNPSSFEQVNFDKKTLGDKVKFLKEGGQITVVFWTHSTSSGQEDRAIDLELPLSMVYCIKQTGPGEKGDSASNVYKSAILENGLQTKVPLFIKIGDQVKIDTRSGEYLERAK